MYVDPATMPGAPKRGFKWLSVKILHQEVKTDGTKRGDPKVECLHCKHILFGGATRVRSHLLGTELGVSACTCVSEEDKQAIEKAATEKGTFTWCNNSHSAEACHQSSEQSSVSLCL